MATTRVFRSGEHAVLIRESGIPDGPDYVLAHGLGMAHEYWDAMAEVIEPTGTVFALDLPGFGGAPEPPRPLSMAESGELLAELLVAEGLDQPLLVGHSTGAQVVSETAARHPELVGRVVLIGATANPRERTLAKQAMRTAVVHGESATHARPPHRTRAAVDRGRGTGPRRLRRSRRRAASPRCPRPCCCPACTSTGRSSGRSATC